jgi:dolichyl-phosphate-mannose--protein O-mannosyl transferase
MKRIELLCFAFFALTISSGYSAIAGSKLLLQLGMVVCCVFYLVSGLGLTRSTFLPTAWKFTPSVMQAPLIMKTLSGFSFAYCCCAISCNELFLHYSYTLSIAGVLILSVVMFLSLRLLESNHPTLNRGILARSALLSVALTFYVVTPLETRLTWRFDDAYYRELLLFSLENPTDEEALRDVHEYEKRMEGIVPFEPIE